jgi:hypothetical protein
MLETPHPSSGVQSEFRFELIVRTERFLNISLNLSLEYDRWEAPWLSPCLRFVGPLNNLPLNLRPVVVGDPARMVKFETGNHIRFASHGKALRETRNPGESIESRIKA